MLGKTIVHHTPYSRNQKKAKIIKIGVVIFCVFCIGFAVVAVLFKKNPESFNSPVVVDGSSGKVLAKVAPKENVSNEKPSLSLAETVSPLIPQEETYGIYIKNIKTNETFLYNEHKVFETASLYKLWIMGEVFEQIENNVLDESHVLSRDVATLNRIFGIPSEHAELTEGSITLTVSAALEQMITISHNYAALLLSEKIKMSTVAEFLKGNEFLESKIGTTSHGPLTTAHDMGRFFEKIYNGELVSPQASDKMLSLLKKQQINRKIPKLLPPDVVVAHKTGELGSLTHDAGIIFLSKGDYIFVMLTDTNTPSNAEQTIASISEAVYTYFEN